MNARHLLETLAETLWNEAQENARPVIVAGQQDADADPFVGAFAFAQYQQGATDPAKYHLPEPILQPRDLPRILIVEVNPGYGRQDQMPTLDWCLMDYIAYYWDRFSEFGRENGLPAVELQSATEPAPKYVIKHLVTVESLLPLTLGPQPLGKNAVFCDAIPWKWNNFRDTSKKYLQPQLPSGKEWRTVWRTHVPQRVSMIATALKPDAVLIMGQLNKELYGLNLSEGPFTAERQICDWRGPVVSSLHPNANDLSNAYKARVRSTLAEVLAVRQS